MLPYTITHADIAIHILINKHIHGHTHTHSHTHTHTHILQYTLTCITNMRIYTIIHTLI